MSTVEAPVRAEAFADINTGLEADANHQDCRLLEQTGSLLGGIAQHAGLTALRAINQLKGLSHEAVRGSYSDSFRQDMHNRRVFVSSVDGLELPITYRVFNEQFLNNGLAYGYNFSLLVPAKRGVEIPTLADIVEYARDHRRAVISTTTDGLSNKLKGEQLLSLVDFHQMTRRRFELYRSILQPDQRLIVTGSSLGGMVAYAMAASQREEAERSGHNLHIEKIIAIASAGHNRYLPTEYLSHLRQFAVDEVISGARYVFDADDVMHQAQRAFELLGTAPLHRQHIIAAGLIGLGILKSPLLGVEAQVPHDTEVVDELYGADTVTHPHLRATNWATTMHPDTKRRLVVKPGLSHLALLTEGRATTMAHLHEPGQDPLIDFAMTA